ncbi:MAG: transposase [Patescibacteria group bacterium]
MNKRRIFLDDQDYAVFLNLLKRYLDTKPVEDEKGREYEWLHDRMELLAFVLMPNHWHMLVFQEDAQAITRLLMGVGTSYTTYFNKKYKRIGPLFQDRYKASHITQDNYLLHISRYIHLNPKNYKSWEFSSLSYYNSNKTAGWMRPERILELFEGKDYMSFVADYEEQREIMDKLKYELANGSDLI